MSLGLLLTSFFTLVQLNCENLFDCRHDSLKNDLDFTPEGAYHWTRSRYWTHLDNTARTIIACSGCFAENEGDVLYSAESSLNESDLTPPDLVTLCEVENDSVLHYLTRRSLLRTAGYKYVMTDSPDERGIDVALLYSPFTVKLLAHHSIRIELPKGQHPTRDILYAKCLVKAELTVHVLVVHAPSRRNGGKQQKAFRQIVAERLAQTVDSINRAEQNPYIIVAGDFNDYHNSPTLRYLTENGLQSVSKDARGINGARGTYKFRGRWGSLDHILASPALHSLPHACAIADFPFLTEGDTERTIRPRRSFLGQHYHYGFSDHLPLVARFRLPEEDPPAE